MQIKNSKLSSTDPCGTPYDTPETSKMEFSKFMVNLRFDRKAQNHLIT